MNADQHDGPSDGPPDELSARATQGILGPNPFVGLRGQDIVGALQQLATQGIKEPTLLLEREAALVRELLAVLAGTSGITPASADKRFLDTTWKDNPFYRMCLQGYLAWTQTLGSFVDRSALDAKTKDRARFVVSLLTDALAPTNSLPGNPAALKRTLDSGGRNLVSGLRNMISDLISNRGMPSQVDAGAFELGQNIARSRGAVVFRNPVLEVIQYAPCTPQVHQRPQLIVPPQVNKFYLFDLAPGKSIVEYLLHGGFQVFMISWRNPTRAHREWDMDTYVEALIEAADAVLAITESEDLNLHGACSGAMTMSALMGHLAARKRRLVNAATLMVAVLDSQIDAQLNLFATPETIAAAKHNSRLKGVLEGQEMGRVFAWLRPNDLVWNYWINNYLMGNSPPAFDILFWNNDTTRLPGKFHGQLIDIFMENLLVTRHALTVLGTPLDLAQVDCDKFVVAGLTDHITPWKGVYNTARSFGGSSEFVLSSSGHIQSIVNPPGNAKAKFFSGTSSADNPDQWMASAVAKADSWWEHWRAWLTARSGPLRPAPEVLGNANLPAMDAAPGTYVVEP